MNSHSRNIESKRAERSARIADLPKYQEPLNKSDISILTLDVPDIVKKVHNKELKPKDVLLAFGKQAFRAQEQCNPVTEVMVKSAEQWATKTTGPLAGIPISLKDTIGVVGYDASVGASKFCYDPMPEDAPIVRMIRDAGGYPHIKTNVPFTLLSFESYNDIWGTTDNPHVPGFTPGGSSGGESALIALGGSRIGIGTDVAGSVRVPAHFSGIYSLRPTTNRFPKAGAHTSMPGQEGIPSVAGPMTRSLVDLKYFFKTVIDMKPWEYDYSITERSWQETSLPEKLKFGIVHTDGIVDPSPACARALQLSVDALIAQGHECVEFTIPDPLEALTVGAQLLCSDGIETATKGMFWGEHNDVGVQRAKLWAKLPKFVRNAWAFVVEHWYGDKIWAQLLRDFHKKTINERWALVTRRERYRERFYRAFKESGINFLLTVPNATPALPHRGLYNSFSSCLYTFLFNIVDYPAGIIPVTKVDETKDQLPEDFDLKSLNGVAKGAYVNYDATRMHGLPVGIQVVGRRFREEDVLNGMAILEKALRQNNVFYNQIEISNK